MSHFVKSTTWWYVGIKLQPVGNRWAISLEFLDDGFCDDDSTEGELRCRYQQETENVGTAIDTLLADAERLGFVAGPNGRSVYLTKGDDDLTDEHRAIARQQAERLGWPCC